MLSLQSELIHRIIGHSGVETEGKSLPSCPCQNCTRPSIVFGKKTQYKEMVLETVGGLFITLHLIACMESNNWLMNCCLV